MTSVIGPTTSDGERAFHSQTLQRMHGKVEDRNDKRPSYLYVSLTRARSSCRGATVVLTRREAEFEKIIASLLEKRGGAVVPSDIFIHL